MSTAAGSGGAEADIVHRLSARRAYAPAPPARAPAPPAYPPLPGRPPPPARDDGRGRRRAPRSRRRGGAAALCLVLGLGLLGGAAAGNWLGPGADAAAAAEDRQAADFEAARAVWHSVPVDSLLPRTLRGIGAGPGGADRTWKRAGVAPDSACGPAKAFDPLLEQALAPVGCARLLRATYTDVTSSSVITVGILVTEADRKLMRALGDRWTEQRLGERADLKPRALAFPGTAAEDFGDRQRASWTVRVRTDTPFVVFSASGFADGRAAVPQSAAKAMAKGATSPAAQAGLGHDARAVAVLVEARLTRAAESAARDEEGRR
ncbi:hypothetical protein [Wenjunlia tyrosinilytica]|uniref:Uncharacterized protein n=1 Tax=Wenjunlia tyrosinilytica TaxID=1544741 RepID=A0A918DT07_9ACTN|nr:hypothetical protein [Wenjunlia tyrosinilytica]GGO82722.1 hypothetical protein GCM10012280_10030 [Wenjunlia tyrosinilytica]